MKTLFIDRLYSGVFGLFIFMTLNFQDGVAQDAGKIL